MAGEKLRVIVSLPSQHMSLSSFVVVVRRRLKEHFLRDAKYVVNTLNRTTGLKPTKDSSLDLQKRFDFAKTYYTQ